VREGLGSCTQHRIERAPQAPDQQRQSRAEQNKDQSDDQASCSVKVAVIHRPRLSAVADSGELNGQPPVLIGVVDTLSCPYIDHEREDEAKQQK
jgi:hypothetical protein